MKKILLTLLIFIVSIPLFGHVPEKNNANYKLSLNTDLDLSIEEVDCSPPANLSANPSTNSVVLSWDISPTEEGGYLWAIYNEGAEEGIDNPIDFNTTFVGQNSITVTGLSSNTTYDAYLRTNCGSANGGYSEPTEMFRFTTSLNTQTSDPNIPETNGEVTSIVSDELHIYIAGSFTEVGGEPRELVARLLPDGTLDTSWDSPLDGATGGLILTMSIDTFADELLIGGYIPSGTTGVVENGTAQELTNRTARIDLGTGAYLGSLTGFSNFLNLSGGIIADENFVYLAGSNGATAKLDKNNDYNTASWNLSFTGNSLAFHRDGDALYVNALTISSGTFSNDNLAKTDLLGNVDENFNPTINNTVNTITTDDNYIYIGGNFTEVNGTSVNYVARLDKTTGQLDESWLPVANGRVYAISLTESHAYIGGTSTLIKVDKTTGANDPDWSASVTNNIKSILVQDEDILIGGNFNFLIDGATVKQNLAKILPAQNFAPFITTWEVTADDLSLTIPTGGGADITDFDFTIDWGDGTTETITSDDPDPTHTYASAGTYTVSIRGVFPHMYHSADNTNAQKLVTVEQWGDIQWESMFRMFRNAYNMTLNASDAPNLAQVTSMQGMFSEASVFNSDISGWDVSSITTMEDMFRKASLFNQDISSWDVSNVTNMDDMFDAATSFNQPLNNWDVSSVTDMEDMFHDATAFNQDIGTWDVSSVTTMKDMFEGATNFNQNINTKVINEGTTDEYIAWDVSSVTDMFDMFDGATSFNQPLNDWDVSSVTGMGDMFRDASALNQNLSNWNVANVTDMSNMFTGSLSTENYDALLEGWSQLTLQNGVTLDIGATTYSCAVGDVRQSMIDTYGWTINDGGATEECETLNSQDFETLNVRLYPNPVSTRLSIEAKGVTISEVSIYDLTGKLVKTSQNTQINVSELFSGAYIIRLTDDSGRVMARKLIKD